MLEKYAFLFLLLTSLIGSASGKQRLLDETSNDVLKNKYDTSTILVSTLDGYLTAIDVTSGKIKWKYNEGPILASPKTLQQDFSYIPNPQTGELYSIVDKHMKKLPFTIPQLVTISPCKSSDGILYSGYKKDVWISINPDSGVHQETVPPQTINSCPVGEKPETVFIGRTEYKIVMSDTKDAKRLWKATYVDYSSHLLPEDESYPFNHFHSSSDGRIVTFFNNNSKEILWNIDLNSVIVNMYLLKKDGMHKLPSIVAAGVSLTANCELFAPSIQVMDSIVFTYSIHEAGVLGVGVFIWERKLRQHSLGQCVENKYEIMVRKAKHPIRPVAELPSLKTDDCPRSGCLLVDQHCTAFGRGVNGTKAITCNKDNVSKFD